MPTERPLRVVQVLPTLAVGGAEAFASQLSEALLELGAAVWLVCLVEAGSLTERLSPRLRGRVRVIGKRGRWDAAVVPKTARVLRHLRPDVVHTHLFTALSWGGLAARLARVPTHVHTQHGVHEELGYVARVDRALCRRVDHLVCCSPAVEAVVRARGYAPARCSVIENGIPLAGRPRASLDGRTVGTVGRMVPEKGQRHLVEAIALLAADGVDVRLELVGDGPLRPELEALVAERGLQDRVRFTGQVDDVPARLAGHDLFALPSLTEALPVALLEAGAAGLPVLLTETGGARLLVEQGAGGWVVPSADPGALAARIRAYLELELSERRALGERSHALVTRDYSISASAEHHLALYRALTRSP